MWKQLIATKGPKRADSKIQMEWNKRKRETIFKLDMCFPNAKLLFKHLPHTNFYGWIEWMRITAQNISNSKSQVKNGFLFYLKEEEKKRRIIGFGKKGKTKNIDKNTCRSPLVHSTGPIQSHIVCEYISRSKWKRNYEKKEMQQENKICKISVNIQVKLST